jgi:hypothetical protein
MDKVRKSGLSRRHASMAGSVILPNGIPMIFPNPNGTLKLAATNIVFAKYKDDQGKECNGWTAALSMMIGEDRGAIKAFKVHAGKSVRFGKFEVVVKRIDSSRFGMVVMAEVATSE